MAHSAVTLVLTLFSLVFVATSADYEDLSVLEFSPSTIVLTNVTKYASEASFTLKYTMKNWNYTVSSMEVSLTDYIPLNFQWNTTKNQCNVTLDEQSGEQTVMLPFELYFSSGPSTIQYNFTSFSLTGYCQEGGASYGLNLMYLHPPANFTLTVKREPACSPACVHGSCQFNSTNPPTGVTCVCDDGWTGQDCSVSNSPSGDLILELSPSTIVLTNLTKYASEASFTLKYTMKNWNYTVNSMEVGLTEYLPLNFQWNTTKNQCNVTLAEQSGEQTVLLPFDLYFWTGPSTIQFDFTSFSVTGYCQKGIASFGLNLMYTHPPANFTLTVKREPVCSIVCVHGGCQFDSANPPTGVACVCDDGWSGEDCTTESNDDKKKIIIIACAAGGGALAVIIIIAVVIIIRKQRAGYEAIRH